VVYHSIHNFCVVDMSAFYLDIIKDRVYISRPDDPARRAAQTVMYEIIMALVRLITPILAFTSEEVWRYIPKQPGSPVSVQLAGWPEVQEKYLDESLEVKWNKLIEVREEVSKALELARQEKIIGNSLNAMVSVYADEDWYQFLKPMEKELATLFIVSAVEVATMEKAPNNAIQAVDIEGLKLAVTVAPGEKCERCWTYSPTVGQTAEHPTICSRCAEVIANLA